MVDIIGDYVNSSEAKLIFNCHKNETVYDCLSQGIDVFESVINNKRDIASIFNKAMEKDCELNSQQTILIYNQM